MGILISLVKRVERKEESGIDRYQSNRAHIQGVRIQLEVTAECTPEKYIECGLLVIAFKDGIPVKHNFLQKIKPIKLCSFKNKGELIKRYWIISERPEEGIDIEVCLINTDASWRTTETKQGLKLTTDSQKVHFHDDLTFDVKITELEPDVQVIDKMKLCQEEYDFVEKRKQVVFQKMKNVPENLFTIERSDDVPTIAIIGSGGGIRAVIGMSASMIALKENGILDYAMYSAGLSGSAWYLLTLYAKDWSNPDTVKENIRRNLHNFKGTKLVILLNLLKLFGKGIFVNHGRSQSVTNIFGEMVYRLLLKEESNCLWSDQKRILQNGDVPLPLIAALQVHYGKNSSWRNDWIEFSPYQVFIPRYGVGINMMHFGKQFFGGYCTGRYNEKPIAFLQGMCGSAYTIFRDARPSGMCGSAYTIFRDARQSGAIVIKSRSVINRLQSFFFDFFDLLVVAKVPNILRGIKLGKPLPEDGDDTTDLEEDSDEDPKSIEVQKRSNLESFLEFMKVKFVTFLDCYREKMMLVDAGIRLNSPYPTVLRPSRNIDLIFSFDFSERDDDKQSPFEELIEAEKWAKKRNLKFPIVEAKLNDIEKARGDRQYDEMYIFKSKGAPTIIHFVMVNKSYRATDDFDIFPAYETLKFDYATPEFNRLHDLIQHNIVKNMDTLKQNIQTAIDNKRKRNERRGRRMRVS